MKYIVGTRGSKLALWQTNHVIELMKEAYPEDEFEVKVIKTTGDKIQNKALNQIGDKGLFTKELEEALLNGDIDFAVHSMKDMPSEVDPRLCFCKNIDRNDRRDCLISIDNKKLSELPSGSIIGCGSLRRQLQIKKFRSDLEVCDIRGNIDTRLNKLKNRENDMSAIVLASAGVTRLGYDQYISEYFDESVMLPASAQGALAIEVASENRELIDKINALSIETQQNEIHAERRFMSFMEGDCHTPMGASCHYKDGKYIMKVMYADKNNNLIFAEDSDENHLQLAEKLTFKIKKQLMGE